MEDAVISIDIKKEIFSANGKIVLEIATCIQLGELVALFGPSGAGKTTLLRMIAGLVHPDSGKITFGNEVWYDSEQKIALTPQQRHIGFMFQDYALFPNMTVKENIRFAQPKKDERKIYSLLEAFGLNELEHRKPAKLSGGQKQRVALARAIAREPKLLLLDEPLSALDSELRSGLQDEIQKAHRQSKTTTLMVSHDLAEVFRLANHVVCIENGKITASGSPMELFSNSDISGKVQITGQVVNIESQGTFYMLTIVTGINQVIKVIAFENDIINLKTGDRVMVFTKAFNPVVMKM